MFLSDILIEYHSRGREFEASVVEGAIKIAEEVLNDRNKPLHGNDEKYCSITKKWIEIGINLDYLVQQ